MFNMHTLQVALLESVPASAERHNDTLKAEVQLYEAIEKYTATMNGIEVAQDGRYEIMQLSLIVCFC